MDQVAYQVPGEITMGVRRLCGDMGVGERVGAGQCRMAKSISIDWQKVHFAKEDTVKGD